MLFLYRAAYYNSQNGEDGQANENEAECIVAKNRHGPLALLRMEREGHFARLREIQSLI